MSGRSEPDAALIAMVQQRLDRQRCRPRATYRLQFQIGQCTFRDAAELVPYLNALGISHIYAAPYLMTRQGSAHGYAVIDYSRLNPELGSEEDFETLVRTLHQHGMGQILDVVPNHMSAAPGENHWWTDVLENGPSSPYADYFDIDWNPVKLELRNKILLPILDRQFGDALEAGCLKLAYRDGAFYIDAAGGSLPIDPKTYEVILTAGLDGLKAAMPADDPHLLELESILTAVQHLPDRNKTDSSSVEERQREKEMIKGRIRRLLEDSPALAAKVEANVQHLNGDPEQPASFDDLERLLNAQVYRLANWKAASDEINYRRFFDVNDLAAVCMEEPQVFEDSHAFLLDLLAEGKVDGLRIDHIDGMFDPFEYLWRLQEGYVRKIIRNTLTNLVPPSGGASDASEERDAERADIESAVFESVSRAYRLKPPCLPSTSNPSSESTEGQTLDERRHLWPLYVLVEKILGPDEPIPAEWPTAGTTGYDFLNSAGGMLVDPDGFEELVRVYSRFTQEPIDFLHIAYRCKLLILRVSMSSELHLLAHRLNRISERHRSSRDFTLNALRAALRAILASFPVYRTYIHGQSVADRDREVIGRAVARAKRLNPAMGTGEFDFIRGVLMLEEPPNLNDSIRRQRDLFIGRFQQVTSPVVAKGVEDTAFYRYYPLTSANEVGGEPARPTWTVQQFHEENQARQQTHPASMICTSTHDTKRSEDTRARISVLAETPKVWQKTVNQWARSHRLLIRDVEGQPAPSRNDQYLFYQTLVGIWPLQPPGDEQHQELIDRMIQYMDKATHEAKAHTSWIAPDPDYDEAVRQFVRAALRNDPKNRFLKAFQKFLETILDAGLYTALSQVLLKLTSPGIPDIYQGQELWDFSLVDPDNRRPVDFECRRRILHDLEAQIEPGDAALQALARQLGATPRDPRLKFFVTWRTLQLRRMYEGLFQQGRYVPLEIEGDRARHLCAFARHLAPKDGRPEQIALVVVPRLLLQLTTASDKNEPSTVPVGGSVWEETRIILPPDISSPFKHAFTGQTCHPVDHRLPIRDILADFPIALLVSCQERSQGFFPTEPRP